MFCVYRGSYLSKSPRNINSSSIKSLTNEFHPTLPLYNVPSICMCCVSVLVQTFAEIMTRLNVTDAEWWPRLRTLWTTPTTTTTWWSRVPVLCISSEQGSRRPTVYPSRGHTTVHTPYTIVARFWSKYFVRYTHRAHAACKMRRKVFRQLNNYSATYFRSYGCGMHVRFNFFEKQQRRPRGTHKLPFTECNTPRPST